MNAKVAALCFAVAVAVACLEVTSANPLTQDLVGEELNSLHDELLVESDIGELSTHHRQKRFTCDALSFSAGGISAGHSACAVHCVTMGRGFKGGFCNSQGVCNCRK